MDNFYYHSVMLCTTAAVNLEFPLGFRFGAATSAYQAEGAWNVSGKSQSVWDHYVHTYPQKIIDGSTGDVSCDSYHNWMRDIDVAEELGLNFYRFSIAWTRLMPTGFPNYINEDGKIYYNNIINELLARNIEPFITIYHWDLPQSLQDLGGWANPLVVEWFGDYARTVFSLYGDRVKSWTTLNEPSIFCDFSFILGEHAPGVINGAIGSRLCNKNVLLAHATAWRIYDKEFRPKYQGRVSFSHHHVWIEALNEAEEDAAEFSRQIVMGLYTHAIYSKTGGWPPTVEKHMRELSIKEGYSKSRLPDLTPEEIDFIRGTYDFYCLNLYTARTARWARKGENSLNSFPLTGNGDYNIVLDVNPQWEHAATDWFYLYPEGMRKMLNWISKSYGSDIEIIVTETGFADLDTSLEDYNRVSYYKKNLEQILLAIYEDGINVKGFSAWTMIDNFEWTFGYRSNFGLYQVDFKHPNRTRRARASAKYYKQVIQEHSLDTDNKYNRLYYILFLFTAIAVFVAILAVTIFLFYDTSKVTRHHEGLTYATVGNSLSSSLWL